MRGIDVAAAEDQARPCARGTYRACASMAASPAAPAPSAMVFCKVRKTLTARSRWRLIDEHDFGNEIAHDRERQLARHSCTAMPSARVGPPQRAIFAAQGVPERRVELGLGSNDLDGRANARAPQRHCRRSSPPPPMGMTRRSRSGTSSSISSAMVPLAGNHQRVVVGVYPGEAALAREVLSAHLSLGNRLAVEHHLGMVGLGRLDLHKRRRHRHDNGSRNAPGGQHGRQPPGHGCQPTL